MSKLKAQAITTEIMPVIHLEISTAEISTAMTSSEASIIPMDSGSVSQPTWESMAYRAGRAYWGARAPFRSVCR